MIWPWRRPVVSQTALFQQWMRDAAKDCATGGEIKPAKPSTGSLERPATVAGRAKILPYHRTKTG